MAFGLPPNFLNVWFDPCSHRCGPVRRLITLRPPCSSVPAHSCSTCSFVAVGPYEMSLVVTGDERLSNVTPLTLLLGL